MAGSRSQVNKAHKSRFASKASRHVHRTSGSGECFFVSLERFENPSFSCDDFDGFLFGDFGVVDKNRIAKPDHRNSVKGGRAARVQRSKMVNLT